MKTLIKVFCFFLLSSHAFSSADDIESLFLKGYGLNISVKSRAGIVFQDNQTIFASRTGTRKFRYYGGVVLQCELHKSEASNSLSILEKNRLISLTSLEVSEQRTSNLGRIGNRINVDDDASREIVYTFNVQNSDRSFDKLIVRKASTRCCSYGDQERYYREKLTLRDIERACSFFKFKKVKLSFADKL